MTNESRPVRQSNYNRGASSSANETNRSNQATTINQASGQRYQQQNELPKRYSSIRNQNQQYQAPQAGKMQHFQVNQSNSSPQQSTQPRALTSTSHASNHHHHHHHSTQVYSSSSRHDPVSNIPASSNYSTNSMTPPPGLSLCKSLSKLS